MVRQRTDDTFEQLSETDLKDLHARLVGYLQGLLKDYHDVPITTEALRQARDIMTEGVATFLRTEGLVSAHDAEMSQRPPLTDAGWPEPERIPITNYRDALITLVNSYWHDLVKQAEKARKHGEKIVPPSIMGLEVTGDNRLQIRFSSREVVEVTLMKVLNAPDPDYAFVTAEDVEKICGTGDQIRTKAFEGIPDARDEARQRRLKRGDPD
jgi:hypothetical protein